MTPSLDDDTSTVYEDMEHEDSSPGMSDPSCSPLKS